MKHIFIAALMMIVAVRSAPAADSRPPNVVLILTDDQGYDDLGCYGTTRLKTPRIDRLAAEGMRFTDFYAAANVCTPSRAALLTGCYPQRVGMGEIPALPGGKPWQTRVLGRGSPFGLNPNEMTMGKVLKARGYVTALVGKWHLGDVHPFMPTDHGFDSFYGCLYTNDMPPVDLLRGDRIVEHDIDLDTITDRYTDEALKFIRSNHDKPFFLLLSHTMPHVPIHAAKRFQGKSEGGLYGDVIEQLDDSTGKVMDLLAELKLDENTLVLFTSDNGPWLAKGESGGLAEPFKGGKGSSNEGGHREPFIMRWPGRIPAGRVCHELTVMFDILPTLAKLTGATLPADRVIDGRDISALAFGTPGAKSPHDRFYYYNGNKMYGVRSGQWKLKIPTTLAEEYGGYLKLENPATKIPRALFNLAWDPGEQKNVLENHPDVAKTLQAMIEEGRADLGDSRRKEVGKNVRPIGRIERAPQTSSVEYSD
jgi:arylsulfatase A-like enzyme